MEKIIEDMEGIPEYRSEDEENVDHLRDMASEGPVIRLVNLIITKAIEMRASDIHFEPFEDQFRVRYRIDGVLHDVLGQLQAVLPLDLEVEHVAALEIHAPEPLSSYDSIGVSVEPYGGSPAPTGDRVLSAVIPH
jgi:type II secretory ATPase GspE/PulE/Tfp pilus assembly ATPase PilB-like protein